MRTIKTIPLWTCVESLLFCLLVLLGAWPVGARASEANPDCDIQAHSCQKAVGDRTVELDIQPKPVAAMKDLTFRVTVSGEALTQMPYIDLGMPGMPMGPNHVTLDKIAAATYEGMGVIVRCPSGKRIWRATVFLPNIGQAEFTFDVVY